MDNYLSIMHTSLARHVNYLRVDKYYAPHLLVLSSLRRGVCCRYANSIRNILTFITFTLVNADYILKEI